MTITNIWEPLRSASALAEHAHRERIAHEREQLRMLHLIQRWDSMSAADKWVEWDRETGAEGDPRLGSEFTEVPGFTPKYCAGCASYVFLDYRASVEGTCPFDATHPITEAQTTTLEDAACAMTTGGMTTATICSTARLTRTPLGWTG